MSATPAVGDFVRWDGPNADQEAAVGTTNPRRDVWEYRRTIDALVVEGPDSDGLLHMHIPMASRLSWDDDAYWAAPSRLRVSRRAS